MFVEEKEVGEVQVRPTTPALRLSEAIRAGVRHSPLQARNSLYYRDTDRASCVWGAAAIGFAGGLVACLNHKASSLHGESNSGAGAAFSKAHGFSIMCANDSLGWTREQIAGWLESQGL